MRPQAFGKLQVVSRPIEKLFRSFEWSHDFLT
jgi:hypothetical protein